MQDRIPYKETQDVTAEEFDRVLDINRVPRWKMQGKEFASTQFAQLMVEQRLRDHIDDDAHCPWY